ncbi:LysR substrate-binding domain-containing protein [Niveibacterium sp. COAC-50]|uniref:LysR substrate-binding domain-containing protein n=1 Tax=Niveibacterium sp. COAC-50 TaxID=2729384 RepID=UPI00155684E3|nr:LysR substrate-binding domain-containing protein [Niveibacterium sp. COAC-50]
MEFNLRAVDLNLLPVFLAAYEERSLSRAAVRLAMTQSATSHALSRLRHLFKDELFIRHSRGMTPTATADLIYPPLRAAINGVSEVITESVAFDPATSTRRFAVSIPHPLGPRIALRLSERLVSLAPSLRVDFDTLTRPTDLDRRLSDGTCDLALDWLLPTAAQHHHEVLFEDVLHLMTRRDHALQGQTVTAARLRDARFVSIKARRRDGQQTEAGRMWSEFPWSITLEVSELFEVLMVLAESDLVGFVPSSLVRLAEKSFDLQILPVPFLKPLSMPIYSVWHPRRDNDSAHRFLRNQLVQVLQTLADE